MVIPESPKESYKRRQFENARETIEMMKRLNGNFDKCVFYFDAEVELS
jgi:hypothetical protein